MATVLDLATASLQDLGVLAAGETPTAGDATVCLDALNRLVDQWAAERLTMHAVTRSTWTIVASDGSYTVGSGGNINIPWPNYIDHVNYTDSTTSPAQEFKLTPLTPDAYSNLTPKGLTATLPSCWYFDRLFNSSGYGNLILWPAPTSSTLTGVIYAATQVSEFSAVTTTVALPPGYRRLIVKSLAAEVAPMFDRLDKLGAMSMQAEAAMRAVKGANVPMLDMSIDSGALGRNVLPVYNIFSDS